MSYTEVELREKIRYQQFEGSELAYSLVKKDKRFFSVFPANDRILILNLTKSILFYVNFDQVKVPFKSALPEPKNGEIAYIFAKSSQGINCEWRKTDKTFIDVTQTKTNEKKETETIQWKFNCFTESLANEWEALLQSSKKKKNAIPMFVQDTLNYGLMSGNFKPSGGSSLLKPEQRQIEKVSPEQMRLRESRLLQQQQEIKRQNQRREQQEIRRQNQRREMQRSQQLQRRLDEQAALEAQRAQQLQRSRELERAEQLQKSQDLQRSQQIQQSLIRSQLKQPPKIGDSWISEVIKSGIERETIPRGVNDSRRSEPGTSLESDWNFMFYRSPTEATIAAFEGYAAAEWARVREKQLNTIGQPKRIYQNAGIRVVAANMFTREATLLKREFKNYHFILEATGNKIGVNVPLCVLVEQDGVVALVKAVLPPQAQIKFSKEILVEIKDLERYTRVMNSILQNCQLYDMTQIYGSRDKRRLIYVSELIEYLPLNVQEEYAGTSLRAEYMLDRVQQFLPGGETRSTNKTDFRLMGSICAGVDAAAKQLTEYLNLKEINIVHALELRDIFHSFGVNMKYLPRVYNLVVNKNVRKYILTAMAAKIARDQIMEALLMARKQSKNSSLSDIVEEALRVLLEGGSSLNNEFWKDISLQFKKVYSMPMTSNDLIGGFFLNSLMQLIPAEYNLSKIDHEKKIFRDQSIVEKGFVGALKSKLKNYSRFTTQVIENVQNVCRDKTKKNETSFQSLTNELQLEKKALGEQWRITGTKNSLYEYLSVFVPPPNADPSAKLQNVPIYEKVNAQPPSSFSLSVTFNYLDWCVRKEAYDEFKRVIENSLNISAYWFEPDDFSRVRLLELLADHKAAIGENQDAIAFAKEALSLAIRSCGTHSKQAGIKYYDLAEMELKVGKKKEAYENFMKAKGSLEIIEPIEFRMPAIFTRVGALKLNSGDVEGCIENEKLAIRSYDEVEKNGSQPQEIYRIKSFQVLSRAYEILKKTQDLRELASVCAKKFNLSKEKIIFEQMVRICLAASIFHHSEEKAQTFIELIEKVQKEDTDHWEPSRCLDELMRIAETTIVMEKFLMKYDHIDRTLSDAKSRKAISQQAKQFQTMVRLVVGSIGQDYVRGLISQKAYD